MKIAIGADHAGFELKKEVIVFLTEQGHDVEDFGCHSTDSIDYPDFAHPVCESISNGYNDQGVLLCGSGNGINMTANKHQGIRSALCWMPEIAELAKLHNDANVATLPARFISKETAFDIIKVFFTTEFEGGRHQRRVDKIPRRL